MRKPILGEAEPAPCGSEELNWNQRQALQGDGLQKELPRSLSGQGQNEPLAAGASCPCRCASRGGCLGGWCHRETYRRWQGRPAATGPTMLRGFTPCSGALRSSPQHSSQTRRGPGLLPSAGGETQPRQVGPRLRPAPLRLLPPPPPTLSGPGLDGRWGHLAKLAFGLSWPSVSPHSALGSEVQT